MPEKEPNSPATMVELQAHRHHVTTVLITSLFPSVVLVGLFAVSGQSFWLFPIVMFCAVGGLNYYVLNSRPVPRTIRLRPDGIRAEDPRGGIREHGWDEVEEVVEHLASLRVRRRMELRFHGDWEPLYLYPYAMNLTMCNGTPTDPQLTDRVAVSGVVWDRPMKLARQVLGRHVPGFHP